MGLAILKLICMLMLTAGLNQMFQESGSAYRNMNRDSYDSLVIQGADSVIMVYRK